MVDSARVGSKAMTAAVVLAGLLPIMLGSGTGSEVMQRIAGWNDYSTAGINGGCARTVCDVARAADFTNID